MKSKIHHLLFAAISFTVLLTIAGLVTAQDGTAIYEGHFILPEDGIYPEGIAYDPVTNVFFVGSAVDGTILRGDVETGAVEVFIPSDRDGNTSVTGMKVDPYGRLWVSGAETGKIFVYDVESGDLIQDYQVPPAENQVLGFFTNGELVPANLVNDVSIASNGNAYFTDSYSDIVYRISSTEDELGELEVWLTELGGGFINGIAVSPDDEYLLIALAESGGLRRVEIATQEISEVELGGGLVPDGLIFDANDPMILYATHFGVGDAYSVARVSFTEDDYSAGTVESFFIEDETFNVATTLAQVEDHLLVVNSQMFTYFDPSLEPTTPWIITNVVIPQE